MQIDPNKIKVKVNRIRLGLDPEVTLFHVEVTSPAGVWPETIRSEAELEIFFSGMKVAMGMMGNVGWQRPEIPGGGTVIMNVTDSLGPFEFSRKIT